MKKLDETLWNCSTSWFGLAFGMNGVLCFVAWVMGWDRLFNAAANLGTLMLFGLMVYGVVKFAIWLTKDIAGMIGEEFQYQVRKTVREELKNLSKV